MDTTIQTKRLTLRPPKPGDAQRIYDCMQEPELPLNLGRAPFPYEMKDAVEWIEKATHEDVRNMSYPFLIDHDAEGVIGCVGLDRKDGDFWELGYWVGKPWWGQGFATEASTAMLEWGQSTLGARGYIAGYIYDNPASGTVLDKLGFSTVGVHRAYVRGRDKKETAIRMTLNAPAELALRIPAH